MELRIARWMFVDGVDVRIQVEHTTHTIHNEGESLSIRKLNRDAQALTARQMLYRNRAEVAV